jgi:hypothetical protein
MILSQINIVSRLKMILENAALRRFLAPQMILKASNGASLQECLVGDQTLKRISLQAI